MAQFTDITVEDLASAHPAGALIGLDLGSRTIGVAASDAGQRIASGVETIRRKKMRDDAARLVEICTERDIVAIVLGLPLNMNGTEGPRVQATRAFRRNLAPYTDLPVVFWDERLSTVAAERAMLEADMSRKRRGEVIDKVAAVVILQSLLDRLASLRAV